MRAQKEVKAENLSHDFIGAFNSFVYYLNIQTELLINPMLI